MSRVCIVVLLAAGSLLLTASMAGSAPQGPVERGSRVALMPVQNRAGDQRTATDLEQIIRFEISKTAQVLDPAAIRPMLRRLRIRNVDNLAPDRMRAVAAELEADWVVSVTLHASGRRDTPWLTVSMRAYRSSDGEMVWADFEGGSGMDRLGVLGTGVVREMTVLTPRVARKLTSGLVRDPEAKPPKTAPPVPPLGKTAIVNFEGVTPRNATASAEAVTEAARAIAFGLGVEIVSPGCTGRVLRLQRGIGWGGVSEETRAALRENCGAESILTGSVEIYNVGGSSTEPEPRVAFGMRFLDAESGKILWTGSVERDGWDREGLFEFGRVHSQAQLTRRIMDRLARQLVKERTRQTRMN